jgi:hypothetical protein
VARRRILIGVWIREAAVRETRELICKFYLITGGGGGGVDGAFKLG